MSHSESLKKSINELIGVHAPVEAANSVYLEMIATCIADIADIADKYCDTEEKHNEDVEKFYRKLLRVFDSEIEYQANLENKHDIDKGDVIAGLRRGKEVVRSAFYDYLYEEDD